ncbi:MAG: hypothetical protein ABFR95_03700 [Actinomycetota bacterium]
MTNDLEREVHDYLRHVVGPVDAIELEEILERSMGDGRTLPVTMASETMTISSGWLVALAAAVAVVVVVGVVPAILGSRHGDAPVADDSVVAANPTTVSPTVPVTTTGIDAVKGESQFVGVDTSAGRLVWTMLEGSGAGIPIISRDINGYVLSGLGDDLLFSADGREWTSTPSSSGLEDYRVFRSDGDWAVAGQSMWRSSGLSRDLLRSDGEHWVKVDLGDDGEVWPEIPLVVGDSTVVEVDTGDFRISVDGAPHVNVEVPWQLPSDSVDAYMFTQVLAAPDGGVVGFVSVQDVHPTDRDLPDDSRDNSALVLAEVWTSADGIDWVNHGLPSFLSSASINQEILFRVKTENRVLHVTVSAVNGEIPPIGVFTSTDGLTWKVSDGPVQGSVEENRPSSDPEMPVYRATFGYVDFEGVHEGDPHHLRIWLSVDGEAWEEVQGIDEPDGIGFIGGTSHGAIDELIYAGFGGDGAIIWIGHFEP